MKEVSPTCFPIKRVTCNVQMVASSKVTALGAAVAAGVTAGVWKLGQKMGDITVFRY